MVYSVKLDSENIFGSNNIRQWADLDNCEDVTKIADRISYNIQEAFNQINSRLVCGPYTVPFELVGTPTAVYDPVIVTLSARLTGVLLYDSRKLIDTENFDEVQNHRKMVEEQFVKILGGQIKLITYEPNAVNYPQAIRSPLPIDVALR